MYWFSIGRTRHAGNSLIEYALPLGIFFVAGTAMVLMTGLDERLVDFFAGASNATVEGNSLRVEPLGSTPTDMGAITTTVPNVSLPTSVGNGDPVCFASGTCVNLSSVAIDQSVETAGGNGQDLTALANSLSQLANQLADAGEDPDTINAITVLANQGHTVAELLTQYESLTQPKCRNTGLSCVMKHEKYRNQKKKFAKRVNNQSMKFFDLWTDAQGYVDMSALPPEVLQVVNLESDRIIEIADTAIGNNLDTDLDKKKAAKKLGMTVNEMKEFEYYKKLKIDEWQEKEWQPQKKVKKSATKKEIRKRVRKARKQKYMQERTTDAGTETHDSSNTTCAQGGQNSKCTQ